MKDKFKLKRLLYNNSEDLYFLTYNIILILSILDCKTENTCFKDYRKLIFLIPIISNEKNTQLLLNYYKSDVKPNANIIKELNRIYYDAIETITLIRYLLLILEKRKIINIIVENNKVNIYLLESEKIKMFTQNPIFEKEKKRIELIKEKVKYLKKINYMTFVENLFKVNGVAIWEH